MNNNGSKIVVLQDYLKARDLLKQGNIEEFLANQSAGLRLLETKAINLSLVKHKLKDAQSAKARLAEFELTLTYARDCLKDEIAEPTDENDKESNQTFLKQCQELIADCERIGKRVEADLANCRFEIFKPLTITGFLGGIPITLGNLAKLFTDDRTIILCAAIGGAAIGMSLVHRYHVRTVIESAKGAIVKSPSQFRPLKERTRNSAFATVLRLSVAAKQMSEIKPCHPTRPMNNPQMVVISNIAVFSA